MEYDTAGANPKGKSILYPWICKGVTILGICFSLYHILYICHVFERFGISISAISHRSISLCLISVLILLSYPIKKTFSSEKIPWWDWILIIISFITFGYIVLFYQLGWTDPRLHFLTEQGMDTLNMVFFFFSIVVVLDITRRTMGLALPIVALSFILYDLFCNYVPGFFQGRGYSLLRISEHLYMGSEGMFGVAMGVAAVTVVCFVIFGAFLSEFGAGDFFNDVALSLFGKVRGGPAKVSVMSSALFGMISGSTAANVMVDGVITIPMMKKVGYSSEFAGAVEAVTSNGGQIMPPVMGAVAFIICEMIQIPYKEVVLAAIIPAVIYFWIIFLHVDNRAAIDGIKGLPQSALPSFAKSIKTGWLYLIPIVAVLFFLIYLEYEPEVASLYALGVLLVIEIPRKGLRVGTEKVLKALYNGAIGMTMVTAACACAGIIIGSFSLTGLGGKMSSIILMASHGNLFLILLFSAITCFFLGMGMSSIPIYLVVAITISPALIEHGVPPLAAHFFVFWYALTSFITPPVAIAAYAAAGISGGDPFKTGVHAMRLGLGNYIIPFMFVYNPALILIGTPGQVILSTVNSLIAVTALVYAATGYMFGKASYGERILLGIGGIILLVPGWISFAGLIPIALGTALRINGRKNQKAEYI